MSNQASEDKLKVLLESNGWKFYEELNGFRKESKYTIPMFSTDQHTNYDKLSAGNYYELKQAVQSAIRSEKLKLLAEVRVRVVGEDEKLVIPDYPKTDDEGEPLYSKRAAKEGRKQVTARYHTRKELRNDQRTELTKLEAEL